VWDDTYVNVISVPRCEIMGRGQFGTGDLKRLKQRDTCSAVCGGIPYEGHYTYWVSSYYQLCQRTGNITYHKHDCCTVMCGTSVKGNSSIIGDMKIITEFHITLAQVTSYLQLYVIAIQIQGTAHQATLHIASA
jgi:hypothetical protein